MVTRRAKVLRAALLCVLGLVLGLVFLRPTGKGAPAPPTPSRRAAPPERRSPNGLVLVDARSLLARIRASPATGVVVGAWASWCESCKEDVPLLVRIGKRLAPRIEVVLVSVDEPTDDGAAARMLREFGALGRTYLVEEDLETFKRAMNPKWPGMLPATFLFDRTATLRYFWGGPVMEDELVPLLERYLAGERIDGEANFALAPGTVTH